MRPTPSSLTPSSLERLPSMSQTPSSPSSLSMSMPQTPKRYRPAVPPSSSPRMARDFVATPTKGPLGQPKFSSPSRGLPPHLECRSKPSLARLRLSTIPKPSKNPPCATLAKKLPTSPTAPSRPSESIWPPIQAASHLFREGAFIS
ncbi:hypothetical protein GALMADRAFT_1157034 [Galerina marginata CBS 339.88]|uniref:Uncharacterized protein n=1 Tax=Galerina marginata (strain CBS 339.88) TaxID=685588 RepID=A0A067SHS2_GALM3|nr:hypothetical protein GALMADRAFT_1157034 [Galerina marginata CBS 339.88]